MGKNGIIKWPVKKSEQHFLKQRTNEQKKTTFLSDNVECPRNDEQEENMKYECQNVVQVHLNSRKICALLSVLLRH